MLVIWRLVRKCPTLRIRLNIGLPARGGDGRLQRKSANYLFHFGVNPLGRRQQRSNYDTSGPIEIVALKAAECQPGAGEALEQ